MEGRYYIEPMDGWFALIDPFGMAVACYKSVREAARACNAYNGSVRREEHPGARAA